MNKEEKYLSEVGMRLTKAGFSVLPVDDGCLPVLYDCEPLCRASEKGTVFIHRQIEMTRRKCSR